MTELPLARRGGPRDLPPGGGRIARLRLFAGDVLIRLVQLPRPIPTLGVRVAAFDREGRVFLVRHSYLPGWHLPGGGIEAGETAREAALREAREEAGLELAGPLELLQIYYHRTTGRRDHIAVFVARDARPVAGAVRRLEIIDGGFFDPRALPPGATRATRARVAEAVGDAPPSEHW